MNIKVFGKQGCAKCTTTKNKLNHLITKFNYNNVSLDFVDMDTVDGMAASAYNDVFKVPTTIIQKNNNTIKKWEEQVPNSEEIKQILDETV